ncbi:TonB-dependent receptor [Synoicihabitans lomoniglobus]|uniref:TonB-dependent receptor n=1 Tax=Synoicihabitans lomoniglobus TaxID=2909285 RepID=A0AAF0CR69_9BACT|nr:TonB-dependent receptor [Opitutaceae bacterium LMO-M01]
MTPLTPTSSRHWLATAWAGGCLLLGQLPAQTVPVSELSESADSEVNLLPVFPVWGASHAQPQVAFPSQFAPRIEAEQLADAITALPNVAAQRRGSQAIEPNIRGQAFDRVSTSLNGLPLLNGSPTRTVSPLAQLGLVNATSITVHKDLPSLALGPPNLGGLIALSLDPWPNNEYATAIASHGHLRASYDATHAGSAVEAAVQGAGERMDYRVGLFRNEFGNYESAQGRDVAADLREWGASLHLGVMSAPRQRTTLGVVYRRLIDSENISLPLDNKDTPSIFLTLAHVIKPETGRFESIRLRGGYGVTTPFLTNEDHPPPPPFLIVNHGRAETASAGLAFDLASADATRFTFGGDYAYQRRNATRRVSSNPLDHIWPNATVDDFGVFAESSTDISPENSLRLGVRLDAVRSDALSAEEWALGRTVREQFITYNGPAAGDVSRQVFLPSANAVLAHDPAGPLSAYAGIGLATRAPDIGQRYRALLPALGGGLEIGNPDLDPETQWSLSTGVRWGTETVQATVDLFANHVDDYISRQSVGSLGPNTVFGYRPINAQFWGGEVGAIWRPSPIVEFPLSFGLTQARNADTHADLAEVPPWELTGGLRLSPIIANRECRLSLNFRHVAPRTNPDPVNAPIYADTASFTLWHLQAEMAVTEQLHLQFGVKNLFNQDHYEYLTPPVGGPVPAGRPGSGDLHAGERIPGPGRTLYASAEWKF